MVNTAIRSVACKIKKTEERLTRRVDKKIFSYGGIHLEIKHKTIFDRAAETDDGKNGDEKCGLLKKRNVDDKSVYA